MGSWVTGFKACLVACLLVVISSCDGDARPFEEQVEAGDLNLQSIEIAPPANSLQPLFIGTAQGIQLGINGQTFDGDPLVISPNNRRWASSDESVLTVSEGGFVLGQSMGTAFVSVRVGGAIATEALMINVSDAPLQSIARISSSADLNGVEQDSLDPCVAVSFSAIGNYGGSDERPLENVVWSIDALSVTADAELFTTSTSPNGTTLLVGRTPTGTDEVSAITLTAEVLADEELDTPGFSQSRLLNVNDSLTSFSVVPAQVNLLAGRTIQLSAPVTYSTNNGVNIATNAVNWGVVEDSTVVSVGTVGSNPGLVTANTGGTATVQGSCGSFTGEVFFTVAGNTGDLVFNRSSDIILNRANPEFDSLEVAQGSQFAQQNAVTNEATWTSLDTSIAIVDNEGSDRGDIRAVGEGTTSITAEFEGTRIGITVIVEDL